MIFCFEHYISIRFLLLKVINHEGKTEFKKKTEYLVSYVSDVVLNSRTSVFSAKL